MRMMTAEDDGFERLLIESRVSPVIMRTDDGRHRDIANLKIKARSCHLSYCFPSIITGFGNNSFSANVPSYEHLVSFEAPSIVVVRNVQNVPSTTYQGSTNRRLIDATVCSVRVSLRDTDFHSALVLSTGPDHFGRCNAGKVCFRTTILKASFGDGHSLCGLGSIRHSIISGNFLQYGCGLRVHCRLFADSQWSSR